MPTPLYLDAARMGRMSPSTQLALQDFVRFAGEYGGTLYFDNFLRHGFSALPEHLRRIHSRLACWHGIRELRETLNAHVGLSSKPLPLLANRTANLIKLAARTLFAKGGRVLITDLIWPSYARILRKVSARMDARIFTVKLRNAILQDKIGPTEVVERVKDAVERFDCRGMFLPAVGHDGIRFPLELLATATRQKGGRRFLAVDGAQAFCHVPLDIERLDCDFLVTGSHKWLGAYLPLGIGFGPRNETDFRRDTGDPLLNFLAELEENAENRFGETVNLMPLISCRAALAAQGDVSREFAILKANAYALAAATEGDWRPMLPHSEMRSGILLLKAKSARLRSYAAAPMRAGFLAHGISLTAYEGGFLRLSMPAFPLTHVQMKLIIQALDKAGTPCISSSKVLPQDRNGNSPYFSA